MAKGVQRIVAGMSAGLLAAAVVLTIDWLFARAGGGTAVNPLQTLEMQTYDWRLQRTAQPSSARKDIALIEIDEFSLKNLQPYFGRWPWPRRPLHRPCARGVRRAAARRHGAAPACLPPR